MRRIATVVILMAAGSAALPSSAAAGACREGSANAAECQALAECKLIGAGIFNTAAGQEAVGWTRRCLFLDKRYTLDGSSGRTQAEQRAKPIPAIQSTFRALYCEAVRRAGQRDQRICEIRRRTSRRRSGRSGGRTPDSGTRTPTLTG